MSVMPAWQPRVPPGHPTKAGAVPAVTSVLAPFGNPFEIDIERCVALIVCVAKPSRRCCP
jgi:hypothetical protein